MTVENKIKLTAVSNEDIKIFSYLCQDAIISKDELLFDKKENMFLATLSRYCWEKLEDNKIKEKDVNYRVVSGLRITNVIDVNYINFSKVLEMEFLNLLAISYKDKKITLHFSLSVEIVLILDDVFAVLEDIDIPWPTRLKPEHI
jgi:hypothetical protein|tara:strand:+ start:202 stop:636 length:435 start_codon:yes stop_codon:yes gene_type:complete